MSALKQYIDLYEGNGKMFQANSCGPLNSLRPKALENLKLMSLPAEGSENYENIDLEAMLAPDFGINVARIDIDVNPNLSFHCNVPAISSSLFLVENDSFRQTSDPQLPEGVTVESMRSCGLRDPEWLARYLGNAADMKNPITALDSLLAQDGVVIRIRKGVRLENPLQIVNILQNGMPLMAVRRVLIVMEEGAEAKLLFCDHTQNPEIDFAVLNTVEIFAEPGSRLDYYDLEESSEKTSRMTTLYVNQQNDSHVLIDAISLFNGKTRNEYYCSFKGENSSLRLMGMGIEDCERVLSTYSRIDHNSPRCHSTESFKYVVDDEAKGSFGGLIYVAPGAVKTEAYQSNRNLVGSDTARMYSKPQLEIYNDDVKCSHGTATGQLDELQMFYMRTRGLSVATAKLLLKQAFMADIIDAVTIPSLKDRLHYLVERRFAGESTGCSASCNICYSSRQD